MGVFHVFFKLCLWCQIAQRITHIRFSECRDFSHSAAFYLFFFMKLSVSLTVIKYGIVSQLVEVDGLRNVKLLSYSFRFSLLHIFLDFFASVFLVKYEILMSSDI